MVVFASVTSNATIDLIIDLGSFLDTFSTRGLLRSKILRVHGVTVLLRIKLISEIIQFFHRVISIVFFFVMA